MRDLHRYILSLAARIVGAHASHDNVQTDTITNLIRSVYDTLAELAQGEPGAGKDDHPHHNHDHRHHHAGQTWSDAPDVYMHPDIGQTVFNDRLVCIECGLSMKMLKRHLLTVHSLLPNAYRAKMELAVGLSDGCPCLREIALQPCAGKRAWPEAGRSVSEGRQNPWIAV